MAKGCDLDDICVTHTTPWHSRIEACAFLLDSGPLNFEKTPISLDVPVFSAHNSGEQGNQSGSAVPFRLDIDKAVHQPLTGLQRTLNGLAGVNLPVIEACQVLPRIQDHKWYVSEQLGRVIDWKVAAIDCFENIYESRSHSTLNQSKSA